MLSKKISKVVFFIPYIIIFAFYVLMHTKYMPEYIDDAWVLSWAYRFKYFNDVTDHVFGMINTRGSILFGTGYSFFYGNILGLIGFTRTNAVILSNIFIWLTSFIWYKIIVNLGYHKKIAKTVSILFLIMECYFIVGNKLRSDSMTLFLISLAFYLFINKKYFFSGLLSVLAFEIHGISLTFYFYLLGYLFYIRKDMKNNPSFYIKGAIVFILGLFLGLAYYFYIQRDYLQLFFETTTSELVGHVFYSYFWKMRFAKRHLPELVIILLALVIFIKNKYYKTEKFILPFLFFTILSTFVLKRGNYHYIAFVYPSVVLLIAYVAHNLKKEKLLFILLLVYLLPQYGYLFYKNINYSQGYYEKTLKDSVPLGDQLILGNSGAWFAFKERNFHEYGYFKRQQTDFTNLPDSFILISNQEYRDNVAGYKEYNDALFKDFTKNLFNTVKYYDGTDIFIYQMDKRTKNEN